VVRSAKRPLGLALFGTRSGRALRARRRRGRLSRQLGRELGSVFDVLHALVATRTNAANGSVGRPAAAIAASRSHTSCSGSTPNAPGSGPCRTGCPAPPC
jgi:hypothetical protein